jgi:hypothetical protein
MSMATRAINGGASAPPITPEAVIALPPVLAFTLGVPAAPRSAVEAVIQKMIDALDQIDGDADFEPGDEPGPSYGNDGAAGDPDDAEDADPDRCLAGDDWICGGSPVYGALGFGSYEWVQNAHWFDTDAEEEHP